MNLHCGNFSYSLYFSYKNKLILHSKGDLITILEAHVFSSALNCQDRPCFDSVGCRRSCSEGVIPTALSYTIDDPRCARIVHRHSFKKFIGALESGQGCFLEPRTVRIGPIICSDIV